MTGFPDLLPDEAEAMRAGQEAVLGEMRRWGYRLVMTSSVESLDVLSAGLGASELRRLLKLTDSDGSVLAIVGERTVPVARLVAGKLRGASLPLRLCYAGAVVRNSGGRLAGRRETHQVGAELIGAPGPVADAEVIAMAVRGLAAAGLRDHHVDVGHAEFFLGLLDGLGMDGDARAGVRAALANRDLVALEQLLGETRLRSAEHELLLRFPALRGGPEIIEAAGRLVQNRRSERALAELRRVYELLVEHGLGDAISIDLGSIRDFDYYTGVIFEGYGPEIGRPLAQGGRYDRLLGRFGRPAAATGFVIHLDLVADALARTGAAPPLPRLDAAISWSPAGLSQAVRLAASLRLFGMRAVVDTRPRGASAARAWRDQVGAQSAVHCTGAASVAWTARGNRSRRLSAEQVVGRLAGASGGGGPR